MARKLWDIFLRASLRRQVDALIVNVSFQTYKSPTLVVLVVFVLLVFDKSACSLSWPATMQIYWSKRKFLYKNKRFSSHRTGLEHLEHQHGRRFIVLGLQNGRHDVM